MVSSSVNAEFSTLIHDICKGIWPQRVWGQFRFPPSKRMKVLCDNQPIISITKNLVHHDRIKYVEIDRYFVKKI